MSVDVAIVGGGLAGAAAAIHLSQRGYRITLLEARSYPHHKVCGEFLSPECNVLLRKLGVLDTLPVQFIDTAEITAPDGTSWTTRFPADALGISRYTLDMRLAERAEQSGAEVREKTPVNGITGSLNDGFCVTTPDGELEASVVLAAHGKRSNLDRALHRHFMDQPQPFVALKNHFWGPPLPRRIELHVFPGGYCGMSEVEDGMTNICLLAREATFQQHSGSPKIETFIEWMKGQNPRLGQWLNKAEQIHENWLSIAQIPFIRKSVVHNDILMAGDSAGLITPLAGNGMAMALQGAELASHYIDRFLSGDAGAIDAYNRHWHRSFGARLRMGRFLQNFMLRPAILSPGLKLINWFPPLGQFFVNQTRDVQLIGNENGSHRWYRHKRP